jgi:hypothetical protein
VNDWPTLALAWPSIVKELIREGELAVVLQCGGRGQRLESHEPKPLTLLPGGDRPLVNLIKDVPPSVPVYIHGVAEERDVYLSHLGADNNFGRRIG